MEEYKFKSVSNGTLDKIKVLLEEGLGYGLKLQDCLKKVDSIKGMLNDGIVRIVLLGSFSDGKTSAIAGLLGRLEDTMKIDPDESSDELTVYRPLGLKQGFEIVDTPGLFGSKEKEVDGHSVKLSDITKKYLSEAHIVIYVCDAVNPLKESHSPIIKWIMRDLGKLSSSIFVINKMDEAGYDMTDEQDYLRGNKIKKETFIKRLRETINLTPFEEKSLNIVCIAADPKGKGLSHWFTKTEDYMRRSHIGDFRKCLDDVVEKANANTLRKNAASTSVNDMLVTLNKEITNVCNPLNKRFDKVEDSCRLLTTECQQLKSELAVNLDTMRSQLDSYKAGLYADIQGATVETIGEIIDRALGRQGDKVTGYVVENSIKSITSACSEGNSQSLQMSAVMFEREFNNQNALLKESMKGGAEYLKNTSVSKDTVFAVRDWIKDWFGVNHKFGPWGAHNLSKSLTKNFGRVAVGINVVLEIWDVVQRMKAISELNKAKSDILKSLDDVFASVYQSFQGEAYYKNYAPSYIEMCKAVLQRENEVKELKKKVQELEAYKSKITNFLHNDVQYVDFKEVD